jgi:signal transduction histidine kinase
LRHKLLLGLVLVVGAIAALLLGTLQGLSSYVATMKTADSKLSELQAVEELQIVVTGLGAPLDGPVPVDEPARIRSQLQLVHSKVDAYQARFEDTLRRRRDPDNGFQESRLLEDMAHWLEKFDQAFAEALQPKVVDPSSPRSLSDDPKLKAAHGKLTMITDELRRAIYDDMYRRISLAKADQRRSTTIVISCGFVAVLLVTGILYFFYGWVFFPIRRLQLGVEHLARGDFDHRIQLKTGDELQVLADAFDTMTARIQATYKDLARQVNERSRQLVRSEKLVSVGYLAAGVAHEINNPLASIAFCAEGLERRLDELLAGRPQNETDAVRKYVGMIQQEAFRCKGITQRLLEFSRVGERREPIDLTELVKSVLEVAQHLPVCRGKRIVFQPYAHVVAFVNGPDLNSVILNLVVNALESMDENGVLTITLQPRGSSAELVFNDTGCGMTAEVLENIFEPFYTRSRTGKGTGLGLFISHQIITQHNGTIEVESAGPGRGSTFRVRVPLQPAEGSAADGVGALTYHPPADAVAPNAQEERRGRTAA